MTHSQKATNLVMEFEGCSHVAYQDGNGIWTIGYGHTHGVKEGDTCIQEQAAKWLGADLAEADVALKRYLTVSINQNQWDALVSFVFDIGQGNFSTSTVHTRINQGDMQGAADAILMWNKIHHEVSAGLVRRRTAERALFLEGMCK